MTKKTSFWIILLGTFSSAVLFLYLSYDTHIQIEAPFFTGVLITVSDLVFMHPEKEAES
jgi:hypothetical protein